MGFPLENHEQLQHIVELFSDAEKAIKELEDAKGELTVPAVNQLRYTGNHLVRYLSDPSNKDELKDAEKHCKRATYDAYEAVMLYYMLEYNKFRDDYRMVQITEVIPDYSEITAAVEEARFFFRDNNESKTRGDHYRDGKQYLLKIKEHVNKLNANRGELNKLIRSTRIKFSFMILGGIAAIVTIVGFLLNLFLCTDQPKGHHQQPAPSIIIKSAPVK